MFSRPPSIEGWVKPMRYGPIKRLAEAISKNTAIEILGALDTLGWNGVGLSGAPNGTDRKPGSAARPKQRRDANKQHRREEDTGGARRTGLDEACLAGGWKKLRFCEKA